jgi:hypothetical protein
MGYLEMVLAWTFALVVQSHGRRPRILVQRVIGTGRKIGRLIGLRRSAGIQSPSNEFSDARAARRRVVRFYSDHHPLYSPTVDMNEIISDDARPSEIWPHIQKRKNEVENLEAQLVQRRKEIEALEARITDLQKRWLFGGGGCPECGSMEKATFGGWDERYARTCPDCEYFTYPDLLVDEEPPSLIREFLDCASQVLARRRQQHAQNDTELRG